MKINYPIPKKTVNQTHKPNSQGMMFENGLNISNEYYRIHNKAIIYKKPTPVQIVRVDYPARSKAKIVEAYYRKPSTTDYNGIYRGKYIDYEAKETNNLKFYFKHIFHHQVEHLTQVANHGGIAFVIIYYKKLQEIYLIDILIFNQLIKEGENGGLKSVPVETARELGVLINQGYTPPIDYLKAVDKYYFKE